MGLQVSNTLIRRAEGKQSDGRCLLLAPGGHPILRAYRVSSTPVKDHTTTVGTVGVKHLVSRVPDGLFSVSCLAGLREQGEKAP